jgi:hypothetical protein
MDIRIPVRICGEFETAVWAREPQDGVNKLEAVNGENGELWHFSAAFVPNRRG